MSITWHPLAEEELNEVASYYDRQDRRGLAVAFLTEAERVVALLAQRPDAGRILGEGVRCWRLRSFPYAVVYRPKGAGVRILAVAGERRRPSYWRSRA